MRLKEHEAIRGKNDYFRVDPRALKIEPGFNVRDLDAPIARDELDRLKESIRIEGVQVPLEIRMFHDELLIVSGHRRHKVVMELIAEGVEIATVPATAEAKAISDAERVARLITLNSGEPLSPLEKAEVVKRLINYGWAHDQIRDRLGFKTVQTIANYEMLLGAPEDVRQAVRAGEVSATTAIAIVRESGENASEALTEARRTTAARGRTRITQGTRKPAGTPKGNRSPAEVEAANLKRLAEHSAANGGNTPKGGNQAKVDAALVALREVVNAGYHESAAADLFIAMPLADVTAITEWLMEFEIQLRARKSISTSINPINDELPADATGDCPA